MTDKSSLQPDSGSGDTTLYRPSASGGLEAAADEAGDYRDGLRADRWNAAPLDNPEVQKTDGKLVLLAVAILGAVTLAIIVIGYGSGFWA